MDEQTQVQPRPEQVVGWSAAPAVPVADARDAGPAAAPGTPQPLRGRGVVAAAALGLALVGGVGGFAIGQATSGSAGTAGTSSVQGPAGTGTPGGTLPGGTLPGGTGGTGGFGGTPPDGAFPGTGGQDT
jgi:hypothetical protein